jgi:alpha-D-ribose 1-methylphosphonate 5-triphosphate synthase subunit PhnL
VIRTLAIETRGLAKSFTLHAQGHIRLPVLAGIDLTVAPEECVLLDGPSGAGKSTLMRTLYGNYRPDRGQILLRHDGIMVDLAAASPRLALELRRRTIGYISQFLRVIPRVPAIEIVAQPLMALGSDPETARSRAGALLERLALPQRLWCLPPATFFGGEQQRVNIARGFIPDLPILLLDEPTASLDAANRAVVVDLIDEKKRQGVALVAIVHDDEIRQLIADRIVDVTSFAAAA